MLRFAILCAGAAVLTAPVNAAGSDRTRTPSGLVIANVTLISPERPAPLAHAYVRVVNGRIAEVSRRPLRGGERIDGTGQFLIPGLIDSHTHFQFGVPAGMQYGQREQFAGIAAAALAQEPRSYLFFGFTTVIALNASADQTNRWNTLVVRPDAHFCGGAPIANGYPMANLPTSIRYDFEPYFLYDSRQADSIPATVDQAQHTPAAVVARMAADGAICVKTYYETGFAAQRNLPVPEVNTIRQVVAEAHARKMPVLMHANSKEAQNFAVAAGVDILAHGMWNGWQLDERGTMPREVTRILDQVAARHIGYQPTVQVIRAERDLWDNSFLDTPALADADPPSLIAWFKSSDGGWLRDVIQQQDGKVPEPAQFAEPIGRLDRVIARLAAVDALLLFGTDTPSGSGYTNPPGLNGRFEMDDWIAAGVPLRKLFRALTIDNARAFHLEGEIGTVERGKVANLLLLRANPLKSVAAYDTIQTVFLHGRPINRETLSARNAH